MGLAEQLLEIERQLRKNDAVLHRRHLIEEALIVFPETGMALHQQQAPGAEAGR